MRIDAHLHFWKPSCGFDNRPIAEHAAYRRDFMPADVIPNLDACHVDGAILVQSAPQTDETDWCIDLAHAEPRIFGVTAWVNLDGPPVDYAALLARPKVIGIRAQLRRVADTAFITRPAVASNLGAALAAGLNVTLLVEARHYVHLGAVLDGLPAGSLIINHLALPFPEVDRDAWRIALGHFARRPATYLQLSGLPFLFQHRWREAEARSVLDDALDILGPHRLVFASDYPMLLRFATYAEWVRYVDDYLAARRLAADEISAVMAGNAREACPRLEVPRKAAVHAAS